MKYDHPEILLLFVTLLCALGPAVNATAEPEEPNGKLSLGQALELAEARHPALHAAHFETQAAEGRVSQATVRPNPALSVEAENFGGSGEQRRLDSAEYTAQIEQTFELGGKRRKRTRVAATERQLTGFDLEAVRLDIRAETVRRFAGVLGAQAQLDLAREAVALAEDFTKAVAARVGAGKVSPMESEKAQILLAQKRIACEQAQQSLATTRTLLASQWGSLRAAFSCADGDLSAIPVVPSLPDLRARLAGNPDVARWTSELDLAQAVLAQERAARLPDMTLAAGVRRASETDSYTLVAGVSVPLPIFDGNQGRIREAEALFGKAEQQRRAAEVKAATELTAAHQSLAAATNHVAAMKNDVLPRVKAVLETVQTGYLQGKYSYLDVLEAQRTRVESQTEYLDALLSVRTGLADLERAVGAPLPAQRQE